MTLRARPDIAPFSAARAAPARYHQAAVSPAGREIAGTSMGAIADGAFAGDATSFDAMPAHAAVDNATQKTRAVARIAASGM